MLPESVPSASKPHRRGLTLLGLLAALVLIVVVVTGVWDRKSSAARLKEITEFQAVPTVAVIMPSDATNTSYINLPGRLDPYIRAPIYARVSGFLKTWYVDIGGQVKAGQLLAEIEAPDLDQQLLQARAALASAQAAEALALVTAQRWQTMGSTNAVARQTVDEKTGDLTVKQANTKAAKANVDRLSVLADFKRVVAPFDGTVTARNTDVGALINADSSAGLALFIVSDITKLRLSINVPQTFAPAVKLDSKVDITVPEYPGKAYTGLVEASARSIDAASGTTRMQVVVDNRLGELMPGSFANTRIELPDSAKILSIPASALVFNKKGLQVATVDAESKVVLKPVTIARDLGQIVEIGTGIARSDRIIDSPPDGISTGDPVRVLDPKSAGKKS
jgi:RND family efflux transporter MFP subunit